MKLLLNIAFLAILSISCLNAQTKAKPTKSKTNKIEKDSSASIIAKDTLCFKYKFYPKDSIYYTAQSFDSICQGENKYLLKKRVESILLFCDSVSNGVFHLRQKLVRFKSQESEDGINWTPNNKSKWLGRTAYFGVDSLGMRKYNYNDDSTKVSLCPGSVFQPNLIIPLKETCKKNEETWMFTTTEQFPENAVPMPQIRRTFLFTALEKLDTLGETADKFDFVVTGQGSYEANTDKLHLYSSSVLHNYGLVYFSRTNNLPISFFNTSELNVTVKTSADSEYTTKQYINTTYHLDNIYRSSKNIPKPTKKSAKESKKNKSNKK